MFTLLLLGLSIVLLWFYFLWIRRHYYRVAWQMPGPVGLPFIGIGLSMMNPEHFLGFMSHVSQKYTCPLITWMGTNCILYVNDPETVEAIFNSTHCTNKGDFYRFVSSAIGDGLFTSSSPRWNKHRRLINPAFSRSVINNFLPIFNVEANVLLAKFDANEEGQPLEIYQILKKIVLEAACQTTMGKKMNFQHDGSSAIFTAYNEVTEVCVTRMLSPWFYPDAIYRRSQLFVRERGVVNVLFGFVEQLLRSQSAMSTTSWITKTKTQSSAMDADKYATAAFVDTTTNPQHKHQVATKPEERTERKVRKAIEEQKDATKDEPSMVDVDVESTCCRKTKSIFIEQMRGSIERGLLSWQDVRDEANVAIAATFETTSTALYFTILCLAMHPEYQDKLHNELVELFPAAQNNNNKLTPDDDDDVDVAAVITAAVAAAVHDDDDDHSNMDASADMTSSDYLNVTNEHLERMTYTEMVINESMRLFAPVPIVLRRADQDFMLPLPTQYTHKSTNKKPSKVSIPRDTQIAIDIFNMQRSEAVWGCNAKAFRPDEHFGPTAQHHHPFAFVPFTKGLRMCIGYRYALMLMKVLLAKIFRHYRIRTQAKMADLIIKGTISLKLREYPLCTVERR